MDEEEFNQGQYDPDQGGDEELHYEDDDEHMSNPEYNGDVDLASMGNMAEES